MPEEALARRFEARRRTAAAAHATIARIETASSAASHPAAVSASASAIAFSAAPAAPVAWAEDAAPLSDLEWEIEEVVGAASPPTATAGAHLWLSCRAHNYDVCAGCEGLASHDCPLQRNNDVHLRRECDVCGSYGGATNGGGAAAAAATSITAASASRDFAALLASLPPTVDRAFPEGGLGFGGPFTPLPWCAEARSALKWEQLFWKVAVILSVPPSLCSNPSGGMDSPPAHITLLLSTDRNQGAPYTGRMVAEMEKVVAAFAEARRHDGMRAILVEDPTCPGLGRAFVDPKGLLATLRAALVSAVNAEGVRSPYHPPHFFRCTDGNYESIDKVHVTRGLVPSKPLIELDSMRGEPPGTWASEQAAVGRRGWEMPLSGMAVKAQPAPLKCNEALHAACLHMDDNNITASWVAKANVRISLGTKANQVPGLGVASLASIKPLLEALQAKKTLTNALQCG